jgi:Rieske Fe-S protein
MLKPLRMFSVMVLVVLSVGPVFAQTVDTAWVRRYDGPSNRHDDARGLAVDDSGNVYVTGDSKGEVEPNYLPDYATIKYLPNGDTAWVRRYDGPEGSMDMATALAIDGSGNVYVTGYSTGSWHRLGLCHREVPV